MYDADGLRPSPLLIRACGSTRFGGPLGSPPHSESGLSLRFALSSSLCLPLRFAFPAVPSGGRGARLSGGDVSLFFVLPYCGRRKQACSFLSSKGAVFSIGSL